MTTAAAWWYVSKTVVCTQIQLVFTLQEQVLMIALKSKINKLQVFAVDPKGKLNKEVLMIALKRKINKLQVLAVPLKLIKSINRCSFMVVLERKSINLCLWLPYNEKSINCICWWLSWKKNQSTGARNCIVVPLKWNQEINYGAHDYYKMKRFYKHNPHWLHVENDKLHFRISYLDRKNLIQ